MNTNEKPNSQLSSWKRFWAWNKSFEPWINSRPTWLAVLLGVVAGIITVIIIMPNSVLEKVLRMFFATKFFQYIFHHIMTSVVLIIAILVMTTPQIAYSGPIYTAERVSVPVPVQQDENQTSTVGVDQDEVGTPHYMFDTSASRLSLADESFDQGIVFVPLADIVSWSTNDGVVSITTTDGSTFPVPKMGLCGALILGGSLAGGGIYMGYRLYKCALRLLYPTNAPPTNAPPTNSPPPNKAPNSTIHALAISTTATNNTFGICLPLLKYPDGVTITLTNMTAEDMAKADVSSAGWTDWQNNLITMQFSMTIWPSNRVSQAGGFLYEQSSTNLVDWVTETLSVTGWVSSASAFCNNCDTNVVTVTYDQYGSPFYTNWYSLQPITNSSDYNSVPLGFNPGVPRRINPKLFFRGVIK